MSVLVYTFVLFCFCAAEQVLHVMQSPARIRRPSLVPTAGTYDRPGFLYSNMYCAAVSVVLFCPSLEVAVMPPSLFRNWRTLQAGGRVA